MCKSKYLQLIANLHIDIDVGALFPFQKSYQCMIERGVRTSLIHQTHSINKNYKCKALPQHEGRDREQSTLQIAPRPAKAPGLTCSPAEHTHRSPREDNEAGPAMTDTWQLLPPNTHRERQTIRRPDLLRTKAQINQHKTCSICQLGTP